MNKIYFTCTLLCLLVLQGFSQPKDSLVHTQITAWKYDEFAKTKTQIAIDTMHANFFDFQPNAKLSEYMLDLGAFGSPAFSLEYSPLESTSFFEHAFSSASITPQTMLFYNAPRPYTELYYSGSQLQQQQVKILHTQNYTKNLNVGAVLQYYKTMGEYTPQSMAGKHIAPWVIYNGSRFSSYFTYSFNSYMFDVNGGILADSLIEKQNFIMSLQNASSHITNKNASSLLKWNLSNKRIVEDSTSLKLQTFPISLGYKLNHSSNSYTYTHTKLPQNWYAKTLWDTLNTYDTTRISQTENILFLELYGSNSMFERLTVFSAGYQYNHTYLRDYNYSYPNEFSNSMYVNGNFNFTVKPVDLQVDYTNTYYVWGDYVGDNFSESRFSKEFALSNNNVIKLNATYSYIHAKPHSIYSRFVSNHYMWNNDFSKQSINKVSFGSEFTKYHIHIGLSKYYLQNYLYFNSKGTILQATEPAQAFVAKLQKTTHIWKFLLNNSVLLQTNSASGIDYPVWASYNSIAFGDVFYKKLIDTYIGLESLYYPKYYAPQYNTSLNVFTQQFDTEIGDFPHVNAFISIKYKPIRVMVSYTGLYTALYGKNFTALHYPQQSGYLTFAVSWLFYN